MVDEQARSDNPELDSEKTRVSLDRLYDMYRDIAVHIVKTI